MALSGAEMIVKFGTAGGLSSSDLESSIYGYAVRQRRQETPLSPQGYLMGRTHVDSVLTTSFQLFATNWNAPVLPPRTPVDLVLGNTSGELSGKAILYAMSIGLDQITGSPQRIVYDGVFTNDLDGTGGIAEQGALSSITRQSVTMRMGDDSSLAVTGPTMPAIAGNLRAQVRFFRNVYPTPLQGVSTMHYTASARINAEGRLDIEAAKPRLLDRSEGTLTYTFVSGQTLAHKFRFSSLDQRANILNGEAQVDSYSLSSAASSTSDTIA